MPDPKNPLPEDLLASIARGQVFALSSTPMLCESGLSRTVWRLSNGWALCAMDEVEHADGVGLPMRVLWIATEHAEVLWSEDADDLPEFSLWPLWLDRWELWAHLQAQVENKRPPWDGKRRARLR